MMMTKVLNIAVTLLLMWIMMLVMSEKTQKGLEEQVQRWELDCPPIELDRRPLPALIDADTIYRRAFGYARPLLEVDRRLISNLEP